MLNNLNEKTRKIIGIISIFVIILMFADNDYSHLANLSMEDLIPIIAVTVVSYGIKIGILAGIVFVIKWLINTFLKK